MISSEKRLSSGGKTTSRMCSCFPGKTNFRGYRDSYDTGRSVVAPYLWREGIRRPDYATLSHHHPDHALGFRFILRNFYVGSFWTSEIAGDDPAAEEIRRCLDEIALKRKIKIRTFPDLLAVCKSARPEYGCSTQALAP